MRMGRHAGERGFYPLSAATLAEKLALTAEEAEALEFFASRRREQREAAKQATRQRRAERNERIRALYAKGSMTQAQVAEVVGCSLRTVSAVLNASKLEQKPAEEQSAQAEAANEQALDAAEAEPNVVKASESEAVHTLEGQDSNACAKKCPTSCCGEAALGSAPRSPELETWLRIVFEACCTPSSPSLEAAG